MKPFTSILLTLLLTAGSLVAAAQETNSATNQESQGRARLQPSHEPFEQTARREPRPADAEPSPNSDTGPDLKEFDIIARKNIFDTARTGPRRRGRQAPRVERIIFGGATLDNGQATAFFEGPGVPSSGTLKTGEVLGGLTIARITLDDVWLTNSSSNTFVLNTDTSPSLRREENGPWQTSTDVSAPPPAASDADDSPSSASAPSGPSHPGETDVEKKMRLRREQEEK